MQQDRRFLLFSVIALGLVSLALVGFLVWRGVQQPQTPIPSKAADSGDPNKCQGNSSSSGKCFDCKKDASASGQINILDFSCFGKWYGKNVGKP